MHVRSDRNEINESALEIDTSEFSGGGGKFPDAQRWNDGLLVPLDRTAQWLRAAGFSRVTLGGSYRLTSLKLDTGIKDRLQWLATLRDRKPHYLMREAIQQYVDREEKRGQFRQGALAAWSGFQASGLHVTAKEADAWLAKLEAGEDAEAPECHN